MRKESSELNTPWNGKVLTLKMFESKTNCLLDTFAEGVPMLFSMTPPSDDLLEFSECKCLDTGVVPVD